MINESGLKVPGIVWPFRRDIDYQPNYEHANNSQIALSFASCNCLTVTCAIIL